MSTKFGNTEIKSATPANTDGSNMTVRLVDGTLMDVHRDVLNRVSVGQVYSFGDLPFETTADRKRKERERGLSVSLSETVSLEK